MNRRSFFKCLPAMPVAAVAAAKVMAEEPKLPTYDPREYKIDNWHTGGWKKITPNPDLGLPFDIRLRDLYP